MIGIGSKRLHKMFKSLIFFLCFIVYAYSAGEVTFLHFPKSVSFEGDDSVKQSDLKEVFSLSLGFTTNEESDWKGFILKTPFHLAEAIVVVVVDGVESVGGFKGHSFPVVSNEDELVAWKTLQSRIWQRYPWENSTQVRIDFENIQTSVNNVQTELGNLDINPNIFSTSSLDRNNTEDLEFLRECSLLLDIADKVQSETVVSRDGTPDIYWFVVRALHPLLDFHGPDSPAAWESKQLLRDSIADLKKAFVTAYGGEVLMAVLTSDASHTRHRRAVEGAASNNTAQNLAKEYSANYSAIFNIILWFMLAFVFSIIAIAVGTASMDPGRDSIIYRMTSNRMKKDN